MSHKQSVLSFFPNSEAVLHSTGKGYLASVMSKQGLILMAEFGETEEKAWRNVYVRICQIWTPVLGPGKAAQLLTNANHGEGNGVHQGAMGS